MPPKTSPRSIAFPSKRTNVFIVPSGLVTRHPSAVSLLRLGSNSDPNRDIALGSPGITFVSDCEENPSSNAPFCSTFGGPSHHRRGARTRLRLGRLALAGPFTALYTAQARATVPARARQRPGTEGRARRIARRRRAGYESRGPAVAASRAARTAGLPSALFRDAPLHRLRAPRRGRPSRGPAAYRRRPRIPLTLASASPAMVGSAKHWFELRK